jgi:hypothetical protein
VPCPLPCQLIARKAEHGMQRKKVLQPRTLVAGHHAAQLVANIDPQHRLEAGG